LIGSQSNKYLHRSYRLLKNRRHSETESDSDNEDNFPISSDQIDTDSLYLLEKTGEHKCAKIKHKNVINYENIMLDIISDIFAFVAVMPVYSLNLWQYLKQCSKRNEEIEMKTRFKFFKNIISGLRHIHQEIIVKFSGFDRIDN